MKRMMEVDWKKIEKNIKNIGNYLEKNKNSFSNIIIIFGILLVFIALLSRFLFLFGISLIIVGLLLLLYKRKKKKTSKISK